MKKIKNSRQLNEEKKALVQKEKQLRQGVAKDWQELKHLWRPQNIIDRQFHQEEKSHWLVSAVSQVAGKLTDKVIRDAERKWTEKKRTPFRRFLDRMHLGSRHA